MEILVMGKPIQKLYDRFNDNYREDLVWLRHRDYEQAKEAHAKEITAMQYAHGLAKHLRGKPIGVKPYDMLAGHGQYVCITASMPFKMPERFMPQAGPPSGEWDIPREINCYKAYRGDALTKDEEGNIAYFLKGVECALTKRWANGHLIAGYDYVLKLGLEEISRRLKENSQTGNKEYFDAMLYAVNAAQDYIGRYEQAAKDAQKHASPSEIINLLRIEQSCRNLKTRPAGNFFEAVQGLWLLHEMLLIENHTGSMSLGRVDQILYPYYVQDGTTKAEAGEIIDALWLKIASFVKGYQNVTLGGCDKDGRPSYNDITILCLQSSRRLRQDQPLISLRCRKDMPDEYWDEAQF